MVDDPMRVELQEMARQGGNDPSKLLSIKTLFGDDLRNDGRFIKEVATAMEAINRDGIMKTLPKYIDQQ